jgi:hypothetical protein
VKPRKDGESEKFLPTPEQREQLTSLPHRVQSAIAFLSDKLAREGRRNQALEPKHLRVGVNSALVEASALGMLLMQKGLVTPDEYYEALIRGWESEVKSYQDLIHQAFGPNVSI